MNLKFLPIGTVCLVENVNKKQMIIGYSKSGYDYVAVEYPKGFESDNKLSYFNHSQVYELYSLGYKNEESRIFNGTLVSIQNVVEEEEIEPEKIKVEKKSNEPSVEDIPTINSDFTFDENGVVISDGTEEIEVIPTTEELSKETSLQENTTLKFDENGVVISDGKENLEENIASPEELSPNDTTLRFDENGIVISDGIEETLETTEEISANDATDTVAVSDVSVISPVIEEETKETSDNSFTSSDATIDVSDVVKQIEETVSEAESTPDEGNGDASEQPKKEKRGLFHFGRK